MSSFLNLTPTVKLVVENPLLHRSYPEGGSVVGVIDTGFEGFLAIPRDLFQELGLDKLQVERRTLTLANGSQLSSEGVYATFMIPELSFKADGFVETYPGLEEILLGAEALTHLKVLLDYCLLRVKVEECP